LKQNRYSEGSNDNRSQIYLSEDEDQIKLQGDQPFILQNI